MHPELGTHCALIRTALVPVEQARSPRTGVLAIKSRIYEPVPPSPTIATATSPHSLQFLERILPSPMPARLACRVPIPKHGLFFRCFDDHKSSGRNRRVESTEQDQR